ncbi:MAG: hypothetical protein ABH860_03545 [bacterium]
MNKPKYYISKNNEFVIEDYNSSPTFSSFFPGIAGTYGIPMWVFYANRGQCITSFGMQDKDGSIMEFQPANKAYRNVSFNGFRTFIKIDGKFYEPFSKSSQLKNEIRITPYDLTLIEENRTLKVRVEVNYFTIPNESFPALARTIKVTNTSAKKRKIEIMDGMPMLIPCGFANSLLKNMSQTIEAWSIVENIENKAPFVRLKVVPSDAPETKLSQRGNFYLSFVDQGGKTSFPDIIIRRKEVFGEVSSLEYPGNFMDKKFKVSAIRMKENFIPCAFSYKSLLLAGQKGFELSSIIGNIDSVKNLNGIKQRILNKKYIEEKAAENKRSIDGITSKISTVSSSKSFDLYTKQSFLDNVMRGGLPVSIGGKPFYVHYRKHGDMERDYNDFKLLPTYFSQGSGNYRDINQNRRNDLFFNPDVNSSNIQRFFNLVQLDGFNPLVVLPSKYFVASKEAADKIAKKHVKSINKDIAKIISKPFILGILLKDMEESGCGYNTSIGEFVEELIQKAERVEEASHGEGFWTDHFSYNIDLLESFECIYPEKIQDILFNKKEFTFFDNEFTVADRKNRYILQGSKIKQFGSVRGDPEKKALIKSRPINKNLVRKDLGRGEVYLAALITKLLCIAANKAASFDAEGIGIEMEADKPDWYDALNGLPGLFGSSISETLELKRLCAYVADHIKPGSTASIPVELKEFMDDLLGCLNEKDDFKCWDSSNTHKENYRSRTRLGISGAESVIDGSYILNFLAQVIKKCDCGISKALGKYGNYYTYYMNEVADHGIESGKIKVKKFIQKPLPLFLEGFVHALKVEKDRKIYGLVKASPLYDKKLKMYKVNSPFNGVPLEIGRAKVFTSGWLENESIWLHMEYKYMLELLRAGLYKEFFGDFKSVLVPFMKPGVYKRSILENSSFIASSAYPDKESHGRGFVARLSGATAEFIDMWIRMTTGKKIFYLDKGGKLCFKLSPILPSWLFSGGKFSFTLLGSIEVIYINKKGKDTFNGVAPVSYKLFLDNKEVEIKNPSINEPYSTMIRDRKVKKIIVALS